MTTTEPQPTAATERTVHEAARLRLAELRDTPALTDLYKLAWPDTPETLSSMQAWLEHGGALVLESIGGVMLSALRWREAERGWQLDRIATLPECRRLGFGRWLMTKVEALAIQRNIPLLFLHLGADHREKLGYYQRLGYRRLGDSDRLTLQKRVGGTWQYKGSK